MHNNILVKLARLCLWSWFVRNHYANLKNQISRKDAYTCNTWHALLYAAICVSYNTAVKKWKQISKAQMISNRIEHFCMY